MPIYAVYGFVRFADEIVDTFITKDSAFLLQQFRDETFQAIEKGFSTNPIIHSFQWVVNSYGVDHQLIHAFLDSMAMDLDTKEYDPHAFSHYIYGSAEVIGLMCLAIFVEGDQVCYEQLRTKARKLGEAFQKINFLRDMRSDYEERGRVYFPGIDFRLFDDAQKVSIVVGIEQDMIEALTGVRRLPRGARVGVQLAFTYYSKLLKKMSRMPVEEIKHKRIRIANLRKLLLIVGVLLKSCFMKKQRTCCYA